MTEVHGRKRVEVTTAALTTVGVIIAVFALLMVVLSNSARAGEVLPGDAPTTPGASDSPAPTPTDQPIAEGSLSQIKNVVLLLADDLDWTAFNQIPRLAALKSAGTTLTNFVVTDSLCCPSRTSFMRSQFVHNHRVISNVLVTGGGWPKFYARDLQNDCLPTWLQKAGVNTSLFGKYLNGFPIDAPTETYIPPGWDYFESSISKNQAYQGVNYTLNVNGTLQKYGSAPNDFLNDVLTLDAAQHLSTLQSPFFMEFATYNPHTPFPIAPQNAQTHLTDVLPRVPSFNAKGTDEVSWLRDLPSLTSTRIENLDDLWRKRLRSAESVADSYEALRSQLKASGHLEDTLIIVTSDNGYHVGVHRLATGKQTAFREDAVVPAVLIGPGIAPGATISKTTSMVDLGPTISEIFRAPTPSFVDGRSLMPLLSYQTDVPWRTATLTESLAHTQPGDPDYSRIEPPNFHALRSEQWLYIEYTNQEIELYNLVADPYEINNVARTTNPAILAQLHAQLEEMKHCTGESCRTADNMPNGSLSAPALLAQ
ncbi:MAG: sulfatase [Actinomycetota bacterium]|nr:sulfatase [Actinomycetota bacterium]